MFLTAYIIFSVFSAFFMFVEYLQGFFTWISFRLRSLEYNYSNSYSVDVSLTKTIRLANPLRQNHWLFTDVLHTWIFSLNA
jgi:hypothetical protein